MPMRLRTVCPGPELRGGASHESPPEPWRPSAQRYPYLFTFLRSIMGRRPWKLRIDDSNTLQYLLRPHRTQALSARTQTQALVNEGTCDLTSDPAAGPVASTALASACANVLPAVAVDPGPVPDGDHHCGDGRGNFEPPRIALASFTAKTGMIHFHKTHLRVGADGKTCRWLVPCSNPSKTAKRSSPRENFLQ